MKVYAYGKEPSVPRFAFKLDKDWSGTPKLDVGYFEMLHKAIQGEPMRDRDKTFMSRTNGSTDLYLSPKAPEGKQSNWLATVPGKGYLATLRLCAAKSKNKVTAVRKIEGT